MFCFFIKLHPWTFIYYIIYVFIHAYYWVSICIFNPTPVGGGLKYFFLWGFKYVALIIRTFPRYILWTLPPLPTKFSPLYSWRSFFMLLRRANANANASLMKIGVKMYFPSYRMCKMAIEELMHSFIFFFIVHFRVFTFHRGFPCQPGQPCWASRAGPAERARRASPARPARPARLTRHGWPSWHGNMNTLKITNRFSSNWT